MYKIEWRNNDSGARDCCYADTEEEAIRLVTQISDMGNKVTSVEKDGRVVSLPLHRKGPS